MKSQSSWLMAVAGAALFAIAVAPSAFAAQNKNSGVFSVGCLSGDTALQSALSTSGDPAEVTVTPATLWPPNHKFADVTVSMNLNGSAASAVDVSLTVSAITDDQVSADDPGGSGCGPSTAKQGEDWDPTDLASNPIVIDGSLMASTDTVSTDPGEIQLRQERCAKVGTRTYYVSVSCCDVTNNVCDQTPETLDVTVLKSRGHHGKP
jgi:hypothetical protein